MIDIWQHALASLHAGERAVLMAVVDHRGSVPGTTGAKAVLSSQGLAGPIGGGVVEKEMCERAEGFEDRAELIHYDHTSAEVDSICMGIQEIAMIGLGPGDTGVVEAIVSALDADLSGTLRISPAGISFISGLTSTRTFTGEGPSWSFVETLGKQDTLYIVGGGHVALALSRIMATLPFRIVVMDDREHLPTMASNHFANRLDVIDYEEVAEHVGEGEHCWAAIMTHAHQADARVLERLLDKDLRYLGMMGSKGKVTQIFANLEAAGTPRELLDRVHSPIGLAIGTHTPEEIAISIAAEIVKEKNTA